MNLDSFDVKILKALAEDARLSARDLGERIGLSMTPCVGSDSWRNGAISSATARGWSCFLMTGGADYMLRVIIRPAELPELSDEHPDAGAGGAHIQSSFALKPVIQRTAPPL